MSWVKTKRLCSFTNVPYAGNPAWVIIGVNPNESAEKLMKLASELNPLTDTTFVFPGEKEADISLRFFSKSAEVKFSGHGTIATYFALEDENFIKFSEPTTLIRQKTKSGIHTVELRVTNKKIQRATVWLPSPHLISMELEIKAISRFLGISPVDITDTGYPIGVVSTEHIEAVVPVKSLELLLELKPDFRLMRNYCERYGITGVVVFTTETKNKESNVHLRHFAPAVGINEDPISGIASAAVGYYLVQSKIFTGEEVVRIVVEQGFALRRAGIVYVHVHTYKNEILRVSFGGQAITTFEGKLLIP
ncbi:MAG: PhzF family phenazine biosynthesis isomerase [candidate division WOR-3 bacterium]